MVLVHTRFSMSALVTAATILSSCNSDTNDKAAECSDTRVTDGLLYVGVDVGFTSSSVFALDVESESSACVLPGQSGDFVLLQDSGRVFGFNRRADELNMREIKADGGTYSFGSQLSLPPSLVGDPSDFSILDDLQVLLVGYNSHALHVVDSQTGEVNQTLSAEWDIPGDGPFFPTEILRLDEQRFLVLHQGYSGKPDSAETSFGVMFEIGWDGSELAAIDIDADTQGVQGHVLKSHLPAGFFAQGDATYLVPGLCGVWTPSCVPALETFDPKAGTLSEMTFNPLTSANTYGAMIGTGAPDLYAQISKSSAAGTQAALVHFDLQAKTVTDLFSYSDVNGDTYPDTGLVVFDPGHGRLFAGEPLSDKAGQIRIFKDDVETGAISTPAIPRQALLVTGSGFVD